MQWGRNGGRQCVSGKENWTKGMVGLTESLKILAFPLGQNLNFYPIFFYKLPLTDNANRAIQGSVVMQPGDHCKLCHSVAKYATNASGAIWWQNLQLMQVVPCGYQI